MLISSELKRDSFLLGASSRSIPPHQYYITFDLLLNPQQEIYPSTPNQLEHKIKVDYLRTEEESAELKKGQKPEGSCLLGIRTDEKAPLLCTFTCHYLPSTSRGQSYLEDMVIDERQHVSRKPQNTSNVEYTSQFAFDVCLVVQKITST